MFIRHASRALTTATALLGLTSLGTACSAAPEEEATGADVAPLACGTILSRLSPGQCQGDITPENVRAQFESNASLTGCQNVDRCDIQQGGSGGITPRFFYRVSHFGTVYAPSKQILREGDTACVPVTVQGYTNSTRGAIYRTQYDCTQFSPGLLVGEGLLAIGIIGVVAGSFILYMTPPAAAAAQQVAQNVSQSGGPTENAIAATAETLSASASAMQPTLQVLAQNLSKFWGRGPANAIPNDLQIVFRGTSYTFAQLQQITARSNPALVRQLLVEMNVMYKALQASGRFGDANGLFHIAEDLAGGRFDDTMRWLFR